MEVMIWKVSEQEAAIVFYTSVSVQILPVPVTSSAIYFNIFNYISFHEMIFILCQYFLF